jgi:hypothetical protein
VHLYHVSPDIGPCFKPLQADPTLKRPLVRMSGQMFLQRGPKRECPTAQLTGKILLPGVRGHMIIKMGRAGEAFEADDALVGPHPLMDGPLVFVHGRPVRKAAVAMGALQRPLSRMDSHMLLQIEQFGKAFATLRTPIFGPCTRWSISSDGGDTRRLFFTRGRLVNGKFGTGEDVVTAVADDNLLVLGAAGHNVHHPGRVGAPDRVGRRPRLVPDEKAGCRGRDRRCAVR